jgi:hypothetical protein
MPCLATSTAPVSDDGLNPLTDPGSIPDSDFASLVSDDTDDEAAVISCAKGFGGNGILDNFPLYKLFILDKMCYYISTRGLKTNDNYATT